ncbi:MAG: 30S ribosomal protein S12 methylthiotransferase RimO, partial [Lachnospiraceae bacterium]|nr:30S ribosomal protein S12 methylthiotransferase RimO [Lachnospiraceae bacterium]
MKVLFVSLGCDKNLADSEKMLGALRFCGHELTDNEEEAEAAVVNTCCFIHDAKQESIETILSLARLKETASLKYLVITGCLAQRYRDEIIDSIP